MRGKTSVGFRQKLPVEALLASAGLVAGDEQDGSSFRIKGKGHAPFASAAVTRSSFMLECFEPSTVLACGRPRSH